jgi:hypothetical protein
MNRQLRRRNAKTEKRRREDRTTVKTKIGGYPRTFLLVSGTPAEAARLSWRRVGERSRRR